MALTGDGTVLADNRQAKDFWGWWFVKGIIWSHLCKSWYVIYLWFSRSSNRFQLVQWIQSDTVPGTLWISNLWDDVGWMFPHSRWIGTSTRVAREWSLRCNRSQMPSAQEASVMVEEWNQRLCKEEFVLNAGDVAVMKGGKLTDHPCCLEFMEGMCRGEMLSTIFWDMWISFVFLWQFSKAYIAPPTPRAKIRSPCGCWSMWIVSPRTSCSSSLIWTLEKANCQFMGSCYCQASCRMIFLWTRSLRSMNWQFIWLL